ncbi:MAG: hypothetical protein HYT12_00240 [Candidatus Liptonbacteria bacterium]|nr:hypothetical protein [Candidatus Liptonbacteria bacterium]
MADIKSQLSEINKTRFDFARAFIEEILKTNEELDEETAFAFILQFFNLAMNSLSEGGVDLLFINKKNKRR